MMIIGHKVTEGRKDWRTGVRVVGIKPPNLKPIPSPQGKALSLFSVLDSCIQWKLLSYKKIFLRTYKLFVYTISEERGWTPKEWNSMLLFKRLFKTPEAFAICMVSIKS